MKRSKLFHKTPSVGAALLMAACHSSEPIHWQLAPLPPRVGMETLVVKMPPAARVRVEANMSHPGMSPQFSTARESAPGRYEAPVNFTMAGDWVLLIHAELAGGGKLDRQIEIPSVEGK